MSMELDRRELFRIIGAGLAGGPALAQHQHEHSAGPDLTGYQPRALTATQYKTLDALCEMLLPADEDGPGAHEAGVAFYLDTVLHYGSEEKRTAWRKALDVAAATPDLESVMKRWAANEKHPQTHDEKFFVAFKNAAIGAFYLSDAGKKSLGYKGDIAIPSFPGCTHPGHHQV